MRIIKLHRKLSKDKKTSLYIKIPILTLSSWLFQGILFMDATERIFKISIDLLIFVPIYLILSHYNIVLGVVFALLLAHTLNWIFNGQIFVLLKNLNLTRTEKNSFTNYIIYIKKLAQDETSIVAVGVSGSITSEELKETSDLDVRIIRRKGILNGFRSCFFVLIQRSKAFFKRFPLDIYVFDSYKKLYDVDKNPVILLDKDDVVVVNMDEVIN